MGVKASGAVSGAVAADIAASYQYNSIICSCTGYNLFKKMDMTLYYELNEKTKFSTVCKMASYDQLPTFEVGMFTKLSPDTELRAKVNSAGEVSGFYKATDNGRMAFCGSLTVDTMHLKDGNHKVGFGVEFLF